MGVGGTVAGTTLGLVVAGIALSAGLAANDPHAPPLRCDTAAECKVTAKHLHADLVRLRSNLSQLESVGTGRDQPLRGIEERIRFLESSLTGSR